MSFPRLHYQKLWTNSIDFPTYEGSEAQVREDMQYHPDAVQEYLNQTLLPEVEGTSGASHIGDAHQGNVADTLTDIYTTLENHANDIKNIAAGDSPESVRAAQVSFTEPEWSLSESGYTLTLPVDKHKRRNAAFGYQLACLVDGVYQTNVWAVIGTDVHFDETTGAIVLSSEDSYDGRITFFGV